MRNGQAHDDELQSFYETVTNDAGGEQWETRQSQKNRKGVVNDMQGDSVKAHDGLYGSVSVVLKIFYGAFRR
jgi:hypothetical protein